MTSAMAGSFHACWKWRLQEIVGLTLSCQHKELEVSEMMCLGFLFYPVVHSYSCAVVRETHFAPAAFIVTAVVELLFSEELGLLLEVSQSDVETVCQRYSDAGLQCHRIGRTCGFGSEATVRRQPQCVRQTFLLNP